MRLFRLEYNILGKKQEELYNKEVDLFRRCASFHSVKSDKRVAEDLIKKIKTEKIGQVIEEKEFKIYIIDGIKKKKDTENKGKRENMMMVKQTAFTNFSLYNSVIVERIKESIRTGKNYTERIFSDGKNWNIDIERFAVSGVIRLFISYEDKHGNYKGSLCTVTDYNGNIKYSCEFKLTKRVEEKVISVYKALRTEGLIK